MVTAVRKATAQDVLKVVTLAQAHRHELGFVRVAAIEEAVAEGRLLVAIHDSDLVVGFVHFRCCRDGHATIYEIAVTAGWQKHGVGQALLDAVSKEARGCGCTTLRLKCPVDLPANGFYARLGFIRVGVEDGKRRPLAVWELDLPKSVDEPQSKMPAFFVALTGRPDEIRQMVDLWDESGDKRNPFAHIIFSPLFAKPKGVAIIRNLKEERGSVVMFDSGGYQVQTGRVAYEELFERLRRFYCENTWANWYVLPDHVPRSDDSDQEVEFKVRETLDFARLFLRRMPHGFTAKAMGVVHGRTEEQVRRCVKAYADIGVRYIGFGSFGTSGPNGSVNMLSKKSLRLLRLAQALAHEYGLRLHIFGIGSPNHIIRMQQGGIIPDSLDSVGWWKAGGFGNIFFPAGRQLHITAIPTVEATLLGVKRQKEHSRHECSFCANLEVLRRNRMKRILHNLAAMLDTIGQVQRGQ